MYGKYNVQLYKLKYSSYIVMIDQNLEKMDKPEFE